MNDLLVLGVMVVSRLGTLVLAGCALPRTVAPSQGSPSPSMPTISTNRPSFSDSTGLVPPGHLQLETGYTFTKTNRSGTETERHAAPEVMARHRLLDRLEGQVLWSGYVAQDSTSPGTTSETDGATDLGFGIRIPVEDQHGLVPTLALGATATIGTGDDDFSTRHHTAPAGKILWSYAYDNGLGLGGNFVLAYPCDGQDRFVQTAASAFGTWTMGRTTLFAEYYVVSPSANHGDEAHTVDGGVLFLASRTVQVDVRAGFGLDDDADDFFAGVGISFLF